MIKNKFQIAAEAAGWILAVNRECFWGFTEFYHPVKRMYSMADTWEDLCERYEIEVIYDEGSSVLSHS